MFSVGQHLWDPGCYLLGGLVGYFNVLRSHTLGVSIDGDCVIDAGTFHNLAQHRGLRK